MCASWITKAFRYLSGFVWMNETHWFTYRTPLNYSNRKHTVAWYSNRTVTTTVCMVQIIEILLYTSPWLKSHTVQVKNSNRKSISKRFFWASFQRNAHCRQCIASHHCRWSFLLIYIAIKYPYTTISMHSIPEDDCFSKSSIKTCICVRGNFGPSVSLLLPSLVMGKEFVLMGILVSASSSSINRP